MVALHTVDRRPKVQFHIQRTGTAHGVADDITPSRSSMKKSGFVPDAATHDALSL